MTRSLGEHLSETLAFKKLVVVIVVVDGKEEVVAVRLIGCQDRVGSGGESGRSIELPLYR